MGSDIDGNYHQPPVRGGVERRGAGVVEYAWQSMPPLTCCARAWEGGRLAMLAVAEVDEEPLIDM